MEVNMQLINGLITGFFALVFIITAIITYFVYQRNKRKPLKNMTYFVTILFGTMAIFGTLFISSFFW